MSNVEALEKVSQLNSQLSGLVTPIVVVLGSTNGTAAAASASLANLAAEAEKIGDDVRAIHAALVSKGFLAAA